MKFILALIVGGVVGCLIAPIAVDFVTSFVRNQWLSMLVGVLSGGFLGVAIAAVGGGNNKFDGSQGQITAGAFVGGGIAGAIGAFHYLELLRLYGDAFRELRYGIT